jgi:predicted N-acetyltransferase YhbS
MTTCEFAIIAEEPEHRPEIETLLDRVFGLSRRVKTSYRLREGETPVEGLSFVALDQSRSLVGAISFWRVFIGKAGFPALLLGPLAVAPERQGTGVGRALMKLGLDRAAARGAKLVILVGDEPYYGRVGFRKVPEDRLLLPGPVDPDRLLYLELEDGALAHAEGLVLPPRRFSDRSSGPRGTMSGSPVQEGGQEPEMSRTKAARSPL